MAAVCSAIFLVGILDCMNSVDMVLDSDVFYSQRKWIDLATLERVST
jgi:hypothetical protein